MKRSHDTATEQDQPPLAEAVQAKPKLIKNHGTHLELDIAVAQACCITTDDGGILLPDSPLVFMGIDEDSGVDRLAYWPSNTETGRRVLKVLEEAVGADEQGIALCTISDRNIRLLDELWTWAQSNCTFCDDEPLLQEYFSVEHVPELGVFKVVVECEKSYRKQLKKNKKGDASDCLVLLSDLSPRLYTTVYHRYC